MKIETLYKITKDDKEMILTPSDLGFINHFRDEKFIQGTVANIVVPEVERTVVQDIKYLLEVIDEAQHIVAKCITLRGTLDSAAVGSLLDLLDSKDFVKIQNKLKDKYGATNDTSKHL